MSDAFDALVVGESILDIIDDGTGRVATPGGSAANVAVGLGRLGIRAEFATYLGLDAAGDQIRRHLTESGVVLTASSRTAPRTSTSIARRDAQGEVSYTFDVLWETAELPHDLPPVLHIGSVPAFEGEGTLVAELVGMRGASVITFDPNIRASLIEDRHHAQQAFERLAGLVDIVKLSDEDAAWLSPEKAPQEVALWLASAGVRLVVLTRGSAGLTLFEDAGSVHVPSPGVSVADTIGAGDTVMTSIIADLVEGRLRLDATDNLHAAGVRAVAAAAITVSRRGANLPWAHELRRSF